jgi:ComF family protein
MTSLLERIVATIAPHHCIVCGIQNNILCIGCAYDLFGRVESACFVCKAPTHDFRVCKRKHCRKISSLEHVWVGANYEGDIARLIKAFKFERAVAAAEPLGKALTAILPYLPKETILVPIPTANHRIRQRGYDQAVLLAKQLSLTTGYETKQLLVRRTDGRQVGATKRQRAIQSAHAFIVTKPEQCKGAPILLVDDVVTTGATLSAAAKILKDAGAKSINAVVVTRAIPDSQNP